jgi:histidinol dehydrogenase
MKTLKIKKVSFKSAKEYLLQSKIEKQSSNIREAVRKIILNVKKNGDKALIKISNEIDKTEFKTISQASFNKSDFKKNYEKLDNATKRNLNFIKKRIISFHKSIETNDLKIKDGIFSFLGQIHKPIDKIGIYAPGGKAVYPSSILMTASVAKVAGSKEINLFFPSGSKEAKTLMLGTAHIAGISNAYNFGGAHAIAAMAYGTETIPRSDKIFGPGNNYVAEAKRQVFGDVGIDSFAGPSEVLIISDKRKGFKELAADLIAQAEHGEDSKCIFIQIGKKGFEGLSEELNQQVNVASRKKTIKTALEKKAMFIQVKNFEEAIEINNLVAPEHLQIICKNFKDSMLKRLIAGAIFIGENNSAVLGDYAAGPSHVIPTNSAARFSSPVSIEDFLVRTSITEIKSIKDQAKYNELLDNSIFLAELEGLYGHANALKLRRK